MKRSIFGVVVASTLLSVSAYADTISISCGAVGQELELCQEGVAAWEKETGHTAKIVTTLTQPQSVWRFTSSCWRRVPKTSMCSRLM